MIYFFCGAPKQGSHFQMNILREALELNEIEYEEVGNKVFRDKNLYEAKFLLDELNERNDDVYSCKGHFGSAKERDFLLSYDNIKIFLIWRDVKDTLVSDYYYQQSGYKGLKMAKYKSFDDFYWNKGGRYKIYKYVKYFNVWHKVSNNHKVIQASFTELKLDFENAVTGLLDFAGLKDVDIIKLKERTSLEASRKKYQDSNSKFFRKGKVGEYKDIIKSKETLHDIDFLLNMKWNMNAFIHELLVVIAHPQIIIGFTKKTFRRMKLKISTK